MLASLCEMKRSKANGKNNRLVASWFRYCDKTKLMTTEEYEVWSNLPDTIEVYRGVGVQRNPDGLSWTRDKHKAEWFVHRFDVKEESYVLCGIAKKEDVLAYFDCEEELVIQRSSLTGVHLIK